MSTPGELKHLGSHTMKLQAVVLDGDKQQQSLQLPSSTINFVVTGMSVGFFLCERLSKNNLKTNQK